MGEKEGLRGEQAQQRKKRRRELHSRSVSAHLDASYRHRFRGSSHRPVWEERDEGGGDKRRGEKEEKRKEKERRGESVREERRSNRSLSAISQLHVVV